MLVEQLKKNGFVITDCPCEDHPKSFKEIFISHPDFPGCRAAVEFPKSEKKGPNEWFTYTLEAIEYKGKCFKFRHVSHAYEDDDCSGFVCFSSGHIFEIIQLVRVNFMEVIASDGQGFEIFCQIQSTRDRQRSEGSDG